MCVSGSERPRRPRGPRGTRGPCCSTTRRRCACTCSSPRRISALRARPFTRHPHAWPSSSPTYRARRRAISPSSCGGSSKSAPLGLARTSASWPIIAGWSTAPRSSSSRARARCRRWTTSTRSSSSIKGGRCGTRCYAARRSPHSTAAPSSRRLVSPSSRSR